MREILEDLNKQWGTPRILINVSLKAAGPARLALYFVIDSTSKKIMNLDRLRQSRVRVGTQLLRKEF